MPVRFRFVESMDMYEPYGSGGVAGRMMEEEIVLCAASSYERKFYLNPEFDALPESEEECRKIYDALPWTKAIIVNIGLPD